MTRVADFNIMNTRKGRQGRVEVSSNHGTNKMNVFIHTPTGERPRTNKRVNAMNTASLTPQVPVQNDPITGYPLPGFSYPEYVPYTPTSAYPPVPDVSPILSRSVDATQDEQTVKPEVTTKLQTSEMVSSAFESPCPGCIALSEELTTTKNDVALAKLLATTFGHILKDNNVKLLANIIDNSGKVIVDLVSLVNLISVVTGAPVENITIGYEDQEAGCMAKINPIRNIDNIKVNGLDFHLSYNCRYNLLSDQYFISLKRVLTNISH